MGTLTKENGAVPGVLVPWDFNPGFLVSLTPTNIRLLFIFPFQGFRIGSLVRKLLFYNYFIGFFKGFLTRFFIRRNK